MRNACNIGIPVISVIINVGRNKKAAQETDPDERNVGLNCGLLMVPVRISLSFECGSVMHSLLGIQTL